MGTYKILIAGNNAQLFSVVDYVKEKVPFAEIIIIITGGLTLQSSQEDSKNIYGINYPTIFTEINQIDWNTKTVYFDPDGSMSYDYFISTATYKSTLGIEKITNVFHVEEEVLLKKENDNLWVDHHYFLIITENPNSEFVKELQKNNSKKSIKTKKAQEIKQMHIFDKKVTSVTLANGELILVDLLIVTSFEMDVPDYIRNINQPFMKLETKNLIYLECADDLIKLDTLISKAKPQAKFICPAQRKLITTCKYLEENLPKCDSYCLEICKMQNDLRLNQNTFLSRFIEGKLDGTVSGDLCNLCSINQCKLPFRLCGIEEEEISIRRILAQMFDSLLIRADLIQNTLQVPRKVKYLRDTFTVYKPRELKQIFRWIVNQNRKILEEVNISLSTAKPNEITCGISSLDPNKDIILYISRFTKRFSLFYPSMQTIENLQIVTLGCGGIEVSNQYGLAHIGNIILSEYLSVLPNLRMVLLENPCFDNNLSRILRNKKIPVIDLNRITIKQFEDSIRRIQPTILQSFVSDAGIHDLVLIEESTEPLGNKQLDTVIFLLPCQGDFQERNLYLELKRFIEQGFIVYSFGCSLSSIMNMQYLNPYYQQGIERKIKTYGSFTKLIKAAKQVKANNKFVYAYNLLKAEALLDLFTLTYRFNFKVWDMENINNNVRNVINLYCEGNKNEKSASY